MQQTIWLPQDFLQYVEYLNIDVCFYFTAIHLFFSWQDILRMPTMEPSFVNCSQWKQTLQLMVKTFFKSKFITIDFQMYNLEFLW